MVLLESMFDILACGPCGGMFGKFTTKLQEDDGDLWRDLGFGNHVSDPKPPPIPKVVSVLPDSDDEDVSTICGTAYRRPRVPQEQRSPYGGEEQKEDEFSAMVGHDLELELESQPARSKSVKFKGSRSTSYIDVDDASLESIMGPRSCRSTLSSRPPMNSLLRRQRQREQYQRFVESFSLSFNTSEDQKECDDGSSYSSVRRKLILYLHQHEDLLQDASQKGPLSLQTNSYSTHTSSTLPTQNRKPGAWRASIEPRRNRQRGYEI